MTNTHISPDMSTHTKTKQLCVRLHTLRKQACISINTIAEKTGITRAHIEALETCDYDALPQGNARKTIVKQYAQCIGYDPEQLSDMLDELQCDTHHAPLTGTKYSKHALPTTIRIAGSILAVMGLLAYLGLEVHAMIGPPQLIISNPSTNLETHISYIDIAGNTAPESFVTINGLKTTLDTQGNFSETIHLKEGVNEIMIVSEAKRGGKSSTSRTILYAPDATKAAIANPAEKTL